MPQERFGARPAPKSGQQQGGQVAPSGRAGNERPSPAFLPCPPDRGLRSDRRLRDGGARRARRLDRLAVLAALRLGRLLRRPARLARPRTLADRAVRPLTPRHPALLGDTLILETRFETVTGACQADRLHATAQRPRKLVRVVVGSAATSPCAWSSASASATAPASLGSTDRRTTPCASSLAPTRWCCAPPRRCAGRTLTRPTSPSRAGETVAFTLTYAPSHLAPPDPADPPRPWPRPKPSGRSGRPRRGSRKASGATP